MKSHLKICGILLFCIGATQAVGQSSGATLQAAAEETLIAGDPTQTVTLAQAMIAKNPNSFAGHFLLALALSDLEQHSTAAKAAGRAYRTAPTEDDKLQSARLAGSSHFAAEQFARSELWLRRAANHVDTEEEAERVVREFQRARTANPLSARFGAWAAPSDNINNGAQDEVFRLEDIDIDFFLPPERLALSGIEYAGEALVSYRLSQSSNQITSVGAYIFGRTFSLSDSAKELVPDSSGSDFALLLTEVSLTHRRQLIDGLGPTSGILRYGRVRFGGDPLWVYDSWELSQIFPLGDAGGVSVRASFKDQKSQVPSTADVWIRDISATYATTLANGDALRFSVATTYSDGGFENVFDEYRGNVNYKLAETLFDTRWSVSFELGHRNYDAFPTTLDGRRDVFGSLGATAVFENVSYWGFSPSVSATATRTHSSAEEFTSNEIEARFSIQSTF